ncbi:MAG: DNA primase [Methanospirillaceae archaeon]|nr:DNA primase [Methanospirillaceae archaeon]
MLPEDTSKYRIVLDVFTEGVVERHDVVGAIFGQTEGLLGEELDIKDLQRTGRLGRIDVKIGSLGGKSAGTIVISSSLDRAETAIIAASIETIDRIGPCASEIVVNTIEDIRITKRREILDRAKELLLDRFDDTSIDAESLINEVRESQRIEKMEIFGSESLPCGPNVRISDAVIIVEGRADVINLLRYGIKNAIAVEGTNVPASIIELCRRKTATAFLDGDRGGDLILKELLQVTDIDFVAFPPRGNSVEHLSRKEIFKSLQNKVPVDYILETEITGRPIENLYPSLTGSGKRENEEKNEEKGFVPLSKNYPDTEDQPTRTTTIPEEKVPEDTVVPGNAPYHSLFDHIAEVSGTNRARFLDADHSCIRETDAGDPKAVVTPLLTLPVKGLVIDAPVTQKIIDLVTPYDLAYIAAPSFTSIVKRPAGIRLIRFQNH